MRQTQPLACSGSFNASRHRRITRYLRASGYVLGTGMVIILPWIQTLHRTRDDPRPSPLT